MRRTLLTVALLAATAPAASAQSGINLAWDHCHADGGGVTTLFDCSRNEGAAVLIASVSIPADLPRFAAATVVVDVFVAEGTLPPRGQVGTGQCRANAVVATYDPASFPASEHCPAIWGETVPLQAQAIQPGILGPDMFRAVSAAAVPVGAEIPLLADGTDRTVCRLLIQRSKTVGADACEGCRVGACFWLKEIFLQQPGGENWRVTIPNGNWIVGHNAIGDIVIRFQPSSSWCTTPGLNRTWGAIKAMYR